VPRAAGRAVLVAIAVALGTVVLLVLTAGPRYGRRTRGAVALQWVSRTVLRAAGVRAIVSGTARSGPSLVVANHPCWLDVLVLAAASPLLPLTVPQAASRPLLGRLATRAGAVDVGRDSWRDLPGTVQQVTGALRRGHRVLAFPEVGVRCDAGRHPFGPVPFQAAVDAAVVISPVALRYRNPAGRPPGMAAPGTANDLWVAMWRTLRAGPLIVEVQWLPVIAAVVDGGHRARHRARAAVRTERAISRALGQPPLRPASTTRIPASVDARPSAAAPVRITASSLRGGTAEAPAGTGGVPVGGAAEQMPLVA